MTENSERTYPRLTQSQIARVEPRSRRRDRSVPREELDAAQWPLARAPYLLETSVPGVGSLRYVVDPTHQHWHLTPFMRYELRRARDFRLARPDAKSGFCLGDRYVTEPASRLSGEPVTPVYNTNCGPGEAGLLAIQEASPSAGATTTRPGGTASTST